MCIGRGSRWPGGTWESLLVMSLRVGVPGTTTETSEKGKKLYTYYQIVCQVRVP